jgi:ribonuclease P protein component
LSSDPDNFRFGRDQRLLKAVEFKYVFAKPVKVSNKHVSFLSRKNGLSHSRLGLAIAKRQIRRAVDRNRLKRLIRECFRHNHESLAGFDIIALVRTSALSETNADFLYQVQCQLDRLKQKCEN